MDQEGAAGEIGEEENFTEGALVAAERRGRGDRSWDESSDQTSNVIEPYLPVLETQDQQFAPPAGFSHAPSASGDQTQHRSSVSSLPSHGSWPRTRRGFQPSLELGEAAADNVGCNAGRLAKSIGTVKSLQNIKLAEVSEGKYGLTTAVPEKEVTLFCAASPHPFLGSVRGIVDDNSTVSLGGDGLSGVDKSLLAQPSDPAAAFLVDQAHTRRQSSRSAESSSCVPLRTSPNTYGDTSHSHLAGGLEDALVAHRMLGVPTRPGTSDTVNVEKQADFAFRDFDGVHFIEDDNGVRQQSTETGQPPPGHPSLLVGEDEQAARSISVDDVIYYPAPVPMMLTLPQRLSKLPPAPSRAAPSRDNRHSQVLDSLPTTVQDRTSWLPHNPGGRTIKDGLWEIEGSPQRPKFDPRTSMGNLASLPPQLRASVFFEHPATYQEVKIKEASAMATLESILDASAHAPVGAFTDHPFAGQLSAELHGNEPLRGSPHGKFSSELHEREALASGNILHGNEQTDMTDTDGTRRRSNTNTLPQDESRGSQRNLSSFVAYESLDTDDRKEIASVFSGGSGGSISRADRRQTLVSAHGDHLVAEVGGPSRERRSAGTAEHHGQPTTLLAELQLRKQQQRLRNMTAATAFPNGMRSTLLELDSVAEIQKLSRKQKRITLAWEDPCRSNDFASMDKDEEVPLAVLFPGKQNNTVDDDRTLGLLEKRDLEENEPLSHRRERLKGNSASEQMLKDPGVVENLYHLDLPGIDDENNIEGAVEEEESLAQRARRLKAQKEGRPGSHGRSLSSNFASDLISQFGVESAIDAHGDGDAEDETLAHRKHRIKGDIRLQSQRESRKIDEDPRPWRGNEKGNNATDILQANSFSPRRNNAPAQSSPVVNGLGRRSQQNLLAGYFDYQPGSIQGSQGPTQPLEPHKYWVTERSSAFVAKPTMADHYALSRAISEQNFYSSVNLGNSTALPRSSTMRLPFGAGMTNSIAFPAMVTPSAPQASAQREMIDRWRLSVMP